MKQAPRCWNKKFSKFLKQFNLYECESEKCLFKGIVDGISVYLALFVDDGLIAAKSKVVLSSIIKSFKETFDITLGNTSNFVGVQIERNHANKSILLHQRAYLRRIICKFHMREAKSISIPADPHVILSPVENNEESQINVPYREAVGSLMFLATVSRPDIAFAVSNVSKYLNSHNNRHWQAVKKIYRYLIGTSII